MMISELDALLAASYSFKTRNKNIPINNKNLKKLLDGPYSVAYDKYKNGDVIYRGALAISNDVTEVVPGKRISENTLNGYTMLMSELLPSWKDYPKRNRSIICTNDTEKALTYTEDEGQIYYVFPRNGAKIGICPYEDIWDSFGPCVKQLEKYNIELFGLPSLNLLLLNTFRIVTNSNNINEEDFNNENKMKKLFEKTDKWLSDNNRQDIVDILTNDSKLVDQSNIRVSHTAVKFLITVKDFKVGCIQFIDKIMNPNFNNFKLTTIDNYTNECEKKDKSQELWTDSTCLFIDIDAAENQLR